MLKHDITRIVAAEDELAEELSMAIRATNKGARKNRLPDPPPDCARFLREYRDRPEGTFRWQSHPNSAEHNTRVAVAWWQDAAGLRHVRVVSARNDYSCWRMNDLLFGESPDFPPLARFDISLFRR